MIDYTTKKHIKKCQEIYNNAYRIFVNQYGAYKADRLAAKEVRMYLDSMRHPNESPSDLPKSLGVDSYS